MVGWLMREEMRWERHCGEGRAERKERCSADRGSDVVAIVIDEIVDENEKNGQVVLSLFLVRRCFIMLDSSMRRARAPSPSSPPSSSIAIVLLYQVA